MKIMRALVLLVVLAATATISNAQPGATASPTAQPTASVQNPPTAPPVSEKKLLAEPQKQKIEAHLEEAITSYRRKGNWYLALYFIFAIGSALASAAAGFVLQWDTPEKSYKRIATTLAFVGSILVIVTTYVNFRVNSMANKVAANETVDLKIEVVSGGITDPGAILRKENEIYVRKQFTEGVIEPPKKQ